MDKIYSRKRIRIPKIKFFFSKSKTESKLFKIWITLIVAIVTITIIIMNNIMPAAARLCMDKAKGIGTKICTDAISNSIVNLKYDDLITYVQDTNGNITMIKSNTINMNKLKAEITNRIQNDLNDLDRASIKIPMGSLTNNQLLYGFGPNVDIKIRPTGNLSIDFQSDFAAAGINQTIHRIYLSINCKVYVLGEFTNVVGEIDERVPIAETIIVGNVPSSYYNLEGLEVDETLRLIK